MGGSVHERNDDVMNGGESQQENQGESQQQEPDSREEEPSQQPKKESESPLIDLSAENGAESTDPSLDQFVSAKSSPSVGRVTPPESESADKEEVEEMSKTIQDSDDDDSKGGFDATPLMEDLLLHQVLPSDSDSKPGGSESELKELSEVVTERIQPVAVVHEESKCAKADDAIYSEIPPKCPSNDAGGQKSSLESSKCSKKKETRVGMPIDGHPAVRGQIQSSTGGKRRTSKCHEYRNFCLILMAVGCAIVLPMLAFLYGSEVYRLWIEANTCETQLTKNWQNLRSLTDAGTVISGCRIVPSEDGRCHLKSEALKRSLHNLVPFASIHETCHRGSFERIHNLGRKFREFEARVWKTRSEETSCFYDIGFAKHCFMQTY